MGNKAIIIIIATYILTIGAMLVGHQYETPRPVLFYSSLVIFVGGVFTAGLLDKEKTK